MDTPPTSTYFDRNSEVYKRLVDAFSDDPIAIVGAGSSLRVGYPLWTTLLDNLAAASIAAFPEKRQDVDDHRGVDSLLRAEKYLKILGKDAFLREVVSTFSRREPSHDPLHRVLVRLPFGNIWTTNYDSVLEDAHVAEFGTPARTADLDMWRTIRTFLDHKYTSQAERGYVHIHGSVNRQDGIVLSQSQYDERYINTSQAKHYLSTLLTTKRAVFIGFGLADADLMYLLRTIGATLQLTEPRHFAIFPRPATIEEETKHRIELQQKYFIDPLYYEPADRHAGVAELLDCLLEDTSKLLALKRTSVPIEQLERLLGELLADSPDVKSSTLQKLPTLLASRGFLIPIGTAAAETGAKDAIDVAIDDTFQLVLAGNTEMALTKYAALRDANTRDLTPKQRYRIEANIGNAYYARGDIPEAAKHYIAAVAYYRESPESRGIEGLGYYLAGDLERARALATEVCALSPNLARGHSLRIRTLPDGASPEDAKATVPPILVNDPEVAMALYDLAKRTGPPFDPEIYARQAVEASPDWVEAMSLLASAIITKERDGAPLDADRGRVLGNPTRVQEAEKLIDRCLTLLSKSDPPSYSAGLYFNRATARRLLGRVPDAERDLREAFRLDPEDPSIVQAFGMEAESPRDVDDALLALGSLAASVEQADQVAFTTLWLLFKRKKTTDLNSAFLLAEELATRPSAVIPESIRFDSVRMALRLLIQLDRRADAVALVQKVPSGELPAQLREVFVGRALLIIGNVPDALARANRSAELLDDKTSWFDRRETALLLEECGNYSTALSIWEKVVDLDRPTSDCTHLLNCAFRAHEWKKLLDACRRMRHSGDTDRKHLEFEVEVLAKSREPNKAMDLLQEWLTTHPDDKSAQLTLSAIASQEGDHIRAIYDEAKLPAVDEVSDAGRGAMCVSVLRRGPQSEAALRYAYRLYRRFPEEMESRLALVSCIFDPAVAEIPIEPPDSVGADTAALISREGESPRWVYVENGSKPVTSRGEYAESHELVRAMLKKRPGESFVFQGHPYKLHAVLDKSLRRVHEIMEHVEEDFPEQRMLRSLKAPATPAEGSPPEEQLGEVYLVLKEEEQRREKLEAAYRVHALPLTSFARLLGRSVFETVQYMAAEPSLGVLCDSGNEEDWLQAKSNLAPNSEVVLDSTALASCYMLGIYEKLDASTLRFVVPKACIDEVRQLSLSASGPRRRRGTMGLHKGRLYLDEVTDVDLAREVEGYEKVLRFVRDRCQVLGGEAALELPAEVRNRFSEIVGVQSLDAVAIARSRGALLWTDDAHLRALAEHEPFGVKAIWTQVALQSLQLDLNEHSIAIGKLIRGGYRLTRVNAQGILDVLRETGWGQDRATTDAVVRMMVRIGLASPANASITRVVIALIWQQAPAGGAREKLIVAVLEAYGRVRAGSMLVRPICRLQTFGGASLRPLRQFLQRWRGQEGEFRPNSQTRKS